MQKENLLLKYYSEDKRIKSLIEWLNNEKTGKIALKGVSQSAGGIISSVVSQAYKNIHLFILPEKEHAVYFFNDMEELLQEQDKEISQRRILFFPTAYKRPYEVEKVDNNNLLYRTEVLKRISSGNKNTFIVSYPEALTEKVVRRSYIKKNIIKLKASEEISLDFLQELLDEYKFKQEDFVIEPGQYSIRGGIVDVFSFSYDHPFRIELFGDEIESIKSFDPTNQRSLKTHAKVEIIPNVQDRSIIENRQSFFEYLPSSAVVWTENLEQTGQKVFREFEKAKETYADLKTEVKHLPPEDLFINRDEFYSKIIEFRNIIVDNQPDDNCEIELKFNIQPQPVFNKNVDLMIEQLMKNTANSIKNILISNSPKQIERLRTLLDDASKNRNLESDIKYTTLSISLHRGFIDKDLGIACFTDHQIFERYHKFRLKERFANKEALSLKELYDLQPGDYVTHIDHGIGKFGGLEKIVTNGKEQEALRLHYKNGDLLYVSIHSLHRISKYTGKDGHEPKLHRLGGNTWKRLKSKTKSRVKDIAKELIALYAKRKASEGFKFSPDSYLQDELEASFFFEDTPDQIKSTEAIKKDMEKDFPMDRLVCGDVGFGKTEVAIRAAFKAAYDNKQVAVLVPTTILALQHYKTFKERLKDFPVNIDYINRFKSKKEQSKTLKKLANHEIDILIGTHRLISKDVKFSDLGLLIVDEEQKFGVGVKEKLKQMKLNVDTLTLTATPIPRTLQFSLMGARDLSIINTPPPNRFPVQTELHTFNTDLIKDAIEYELARRGQVYMINNRVQNIAEVAALIERLVPKARIGIAHGQMDGSRLEKTMLDFIEGDFDVLIATSIIENGLDIPNANTMIINNAQNFGLSDLHQLRGRVGRTNKKAFCYLITPPESVLSDVASQRLKALTQFSDLGSGFNIAMRDLDIRGAGNILGAEQSGFISEIGYEMYQMIMDEALQELKNESDSDSDESQNYEAKDFVGDCKIDIDMDVMIPTDYIHNTTERLSIYKKLDACENLKEINDVKEEIEDRFGPIPKSVYDLIKTIELRWLAVEMGFEKIALKQNNFYAWFVSNQESDFYKSKYFAALISVLQKHPQLAQLKERKSKLSLNFGKIINVEQAIKKLEFLKNKFDENIESMA
jgi:transcription-repair coupling factor (superfamily II helicase)